MRESDRMDLIKSWKMDLRRTRLCRIEEKSTLLNA
tara:strand:+ start:1256 stop:1360 length:105 start_codon:yes stop_codon:yes gene_type:complete